MGCLLLLGEDIYSQHLREKSSVVCKRLPSMPGVFTVNVAELCPSSVHKKQIDVSLFKTVVKNSQEKLDEENNCHLPFLPKQIERTCKCRLVHEF